MVNVAALMPSDIERLSGVKLSNEDKTSILSSITTMLQEVRPDGGADSDRIFMAAQMLDMANVWDQIDAAELAKAIDNAPSDATKEFLEGLPHVYAGEVALKILTEPTLAEGHHASAVYVRRVRAKPNMTIRVNRFGTVCVLEEMTQASFPADLEEDLGPDPRLLMEEFDDFLRTELGELAHPIEQPKRA